MLLIDITVLAVNIFAQHCILRNLSTIVDFQVGKIGRQTRVEIFGFVDLFKKKINTSRLIPVKHMKY